MKFSIAAIILGVALLASAEKLRFDNHKVFRVIPKTEAHRDMLASYEENTSQVTFWSCASKVGSPVDIMVPPYMQAEFVATLEHQGMEVSTMIENVQSLIEEEEAQSKQGRSKSPRLGWEAYYGTDEVHAFLDEQAALHPDIASVINLGQSYEGRDLKLMKISTGGAGKRAIWMDATIHAREWITTAVATYTINELLNSDAPEIVQMREDYDWYIIPILNPDGYEYTRTSNRMWRKTRSEHPTNICRGADPNRNWAWGWMTGGSSANPCSDTFAGTDPFSEIENKLAAEFLDSIQDTVDFYLSLHSYSQLILLPYGNSTDRYPDYQEFMRIGSVAAQAIGQRYGTNFRYGNIVDMLYVASGGSMDYMKGTWNTKLTYTFEMRDTGAYGFLLPPSQIIPSSLEFMDCLVAMVNELKNMP